MARSWHVRYALAYTVVMLAGGTVSLLQLHAEAPLDDAQWVQVAPAQYAGEQVAQAPAPQPVPVIPETVVPGEVTTPTDATPQPGEPQVGPFGPGGVFSNRVEGPFLPDVEGTKINVGKKTANVDLQARPPIIDTNYRQALITVPGLLLSEENVPLIAIGYRGLDPDRNQFMLMLEDGIPLGANIMGFNESYYLPPLQIVDHIEFIHGGSALMYGPQPGGALNFVTKDPIPDRACAFFAENAYGSHNFFSTFEGITGTLNTGFGDFGYYVYGLHRQSQGFRTFNSRYDLDYTGGKFIIQTNPNSRLIMNVNAYDEKHGEPGRLDRPTFYINPRIATRPHDVFELKRLFGSFDYQEVIDDDSYLEVQTWTNYFERFSRRQRGGGFGTVPTDNVSDYRLEQFNVFGFQPRLRHDYRIFDGEAVQTLSVGMLYYLNMGDRKDTRGPVESPNRVSVEPRTLADRDTHYLSFFGENRFQVGDLSVVPGIRLESIWQSVHENFNAGKLEDGVPFGDKEANDFVPLLGLGTAYEFTPRSQVYGNISQAYRPLLFQETVSPGPADIVSGDIGPGRSYQGEVGFRTNPAPYFTMDTSLFYLEFNDQVGQIGPVIQNVGDSRHRGWEFATEMDLIGLANAWDGYDMPAPNAVGVFFNTMLLNARFFEGPVAGKSPQYAPEYIMRTGFTYTYRDISDYFNGNQGRNNGYGNNGYYRNGTYYGRDRFRIWFTGTFVGRHFGDDGNSPDFFIPSYKVWDLTFDYKLYRNTVTLFGGIYNIFDEQYFARVRADGIEPLDFRNYQGGIRIFW